MEDFHFLCHHKVPVISECHHELLMVEKKMSDAMSRIGEDSQNPIFFLELTPPYCNYCMKTFVYHNPNFSFGPNSWDKRTFRWFEMSAQQHHLAITFPLRLPFLSIFQPLFWPFNLLRIRFHGIWELTNIMSFSFIFHVRG